MSEDQNDEHITITISYINYGNDDRLQLTTSWNKVPDQSKVWNKAKQLIDSLYKQVR